MGGCWFASAAGWRSGFGASIVAGGNGRQRHGCVLGVESRLPDASTCPSCQTACTLERKTVRIQPAGGERVTLHGVEVFQCPNCAHVHVTEDGRRLCFAALGADPDRPLPLPVRIWVLASPPTSELTPETRDG